MTVPILEMHSVQKRFKRKTVLQSVHITVPTGCVLGLLGKNAAGKSTLLKCALGLLRPQEGTSTLLGENSWDLSDKAKARLGYVPQEITLYPWMRIDQLIAYTAAFYPHWNDQLIEKLLQEWELDPEDRVGPLSSGQLQKLAILLALGHEPDLLILDEPVSSLDPEARRDFLKMILEIAGSGDRTIIFSTHITSDLERVADRVAILKQGRIVYHDELDALKDGVKRLRISTEVPLPTGVSSIPGVLRCEANGNHALLSVRNYGPEVVAQLERNWNASIQVEDLNLEEIFLEMHHG